MVLENRNFYMGLKSFGYCRFSFGGLVESHLRTFGFCVLLTAGKKVGFSYPGYEMST